jgi:hypothetical protein
MFDGTFMRGPAAICGLTAIAPLLIQIPDSTCSKIPFGWEANMTATRCLRFETIWTFDDEHHDSPQNLHMLPFSNMPPSIKAISPLDS